ncbi:MAG: hypothetical protein VYA30_12210 [Myxococcota bacterium]|nr:hypothetical protein [Myxococcota bacterium]
MGERKRRLLKFKAEGSAQIRSACWPLFLLALLNCSDPASHLSCRTEDDCRSGEICRFMRCQAPQQCQRNSDCGPTDVCLNSICSPRQCENDSTCGDDRLCILGWCQSAVPGVCQTDSDCLFGECDQTRGQCLLPRSCDATPCDNPSRALDESCDGTACNSACRESADCPVTEMCDQETQRCIERDCDSDQDCQVVEDCDDGRCEPGCRLNSPTCQPGQCDPDTRECLTNRCLRHPDCVDGYCEVILEQEQPKRRCTTGERPRTFQLCTDDQSCPSGACLESGFCFWPCSSGSDCPSGLCALDAWSVGQATYSLRTCIAQDLSCQNDIECAVGRTCLPSVADQRTRLTCQPTPPGRNPGSRCQNHSDCQSQVCLDATCWGPCVPDTEGHCGIGHVCYENVHYLVAQANDANGPYLGFSGCLPNFGSDSDCESRSCIDDEVCVLKPDSQRAGWTTRCQRAIGDRGAGAGCQHDIECRSRWCSAEGFCVEPCDLMNPDENCLEGTVCQIVLLPLWRSENENVLEDAASICAPRP